MAPPCLWVPSHHFPETQHGWHGLLATPRVPEANSAKLPNRVILRVPPKPLLLSLKFKVFISEKPGHQHPCRRARENLLSAQRWHPCPPQQCCASREHLLPSKESTLSCTAGETYNTERCALLPSMNRVAMGKRDGASSSEQHSSVLTLHRELSLETKNMYNE